MSDWITIEELKPYDGRYEFELLDKLPTVREWGWLKRHTGTLPPQFLEAVIGGDQEVISACAVITLVRAGKVTRDDFDDVYERTLDVEGGSFRIEIGVREEPSVPLPERLNGNEPLFWGRFDDEYGEIPARPEELWDARLGYFGVSPHDVGDLTPRQMLDCADLFKELLMAKVT